jgi:hypothetical protein
MRDTHDTRDLSFDLMNLTEAGVVTTRTLTIVLPESEWQALRTAEPDAIAWLQAQIRRRLGDEPASKRQDESAFDEY